MITNALERSPYLSGSTLRVMRLAAILWLFALSHFVMAAAPITATPASLTFTMVGCDIRVQQCGSPTLPPPETLYIGTNLPAGAAMILTSSLPIWMNISPGSGYPTAPLTLQVSIVATYSPLAPGTYSATLRFDTMSDYGTATARTVTVPITLIATTPASPVSYSGVCRHCIFQLPERWRNSDTTNGDVS